MADLMERDNQRLGDADVPDRRRPGRLTHKNPHLIAILRKPVSSPESCAPESEFFSEEADSLVAARGIAVATLMGIGGWAVIALLPMLTFLR